MSVSYTVIATIPDEATRDEYIAWLVDGHVQAVVAGGAVSAEVIRVDDPAFPIEVQARYTFPSRAAYDRYLSEHAPALREEGLARFPASRGIKLRREFGAIL